MVSSRERKQQKDMAERILEPDEVAANRKSKDSVFTDLFDQPEYLIQLYRVLHPEDKDAEESDLTVVTLGNLMLREQYNDLGFMVGNRLMVLVECQSTWSVNIVVRFLMYLGDTYQKYIRRNPEMRLYGTKRLELPKPELYLIYTGGRGEKPDSISLRRDIFGDENCCVEVEAKVLYESAHGDILDQYMVFTRVFDEQIRQLGRTREAVLETIRICRKEDVLKDYLEKEEVADIMFTFMDKEEELKRFVNEERTEAKEEGRAEGILVSLRNLVRNMNLSVQQAMIMLGIPEEEQGKYASRI